MSEILVSFVFVDSKKSIQDNMLYILDLFESIKDKAKIDEYSEYTLVDFPANSFLFQVKIGYDIQYLVIFNFRAFSLSSDEETLIKQLQIEIYSTEESSVQIDHALHDLKLAIKNEIRKDWEKCFWLQDKQASSISSSLYPVIHEAENSIRFLINDLMVKYYGIEWWDIIVPHQLKEKHSNRLSEYKQAAPSFIDVEEHLLLIDIDDLKEIITRQYCYWEPQYNNEIEAILSGNAPNHGDSLYSKLKKQLKLKYDLWEDIFSKYLPENFLELLSRFSKNRNHVAHNKLLDYSAKQKINDSCKEITDAVNIAMRKVKETVISQEEAERSKRLLLEQQEKEKDLLHYHMETEAGIRIRDEKDIYDLFDENVSEFISNLEDSMYFRNDIRFECIDEEEDHKIRIDSKVINIDPLKIHIYFDINEDAGATSYINLHFESGSNSFLRQIEYINGDAEFSLDQGYYLPTTQDKFDKDALNSLFEEVFSMVNEAFPNLKEQVDLMSYEIGRCRIPSPVAEDIECADCGECYVCINTEFADYGVCLNCGYENVLNVCERCECLYNSEIDGDKYYCDGCLNYFRSQ